MPSRQDTVNDPTIETVDEALFSGLERKISPNYWHWRQQSPYENIRAKVHVMMAVQPLGHSSVEPAELFELRRDNILERAHQCWIKKDGGQTMAPKTLGNSLLMLHELGGAARRRKRGSEVEMQPSIDLLLSCNRRGTFGILHKNHCTD